MSEFYNQGAVPLDSGAYIPRRFEAEVFNDVVAGRWVLLLGPRQHGKTSGLVRLAKQCRDRGFLTATVDLQALPPCPDFRLLLRAVADQIARSRGVAVALPRPEEDGQIVNWLEAAFPPAETPILLVIDEAASIENADFRNAFYGQIRQISSARATAARDAFVARVRFVFAGTFRPETLVQERNSPFNVCQSVPTDDVTVDQARTLATAVNPNFVGFVEEAHRVLNGQPFLLQTVFQETARRMDAQPELAFRECLENMPQLVSQHLEGIFSKIVGNAALAQKVGQMVRAGEFDVIPADSDCHYLQVLGLAKRQGAKLVFRNQLYARTAAGSAQIPQPAPGGVNHGTVFGIPKSDFSKVKNPALQEICYSSYDGATKAHCSGHFRLALTGFGSAMESLLLSFLMQQTAANLATAVQTACAQRDQTKHVRFNNFETAADPKTWRLVNLINAARQLRVGVNSTDPSHALREWRNLVHPAAAMQGDPSEGRLAPESAAASAHFAMLLRDMPA